MGGWNFKISTFSGVIIFSFQPASSVLSMTVCIGNVIITPSVVFVPMMCCRVSSHMPKCVVVESSDIAKYFDIKRACVNFNQRFTDRSATYRLIHRLSRWLSRRCINFVITFNILLNRVLTTFYFSGWKLRQHLRSARLLQTNNW